MFKDSIRLPIIFIIASTVWQLIVNKGVNWIDNIGISFVMFLIILLFSWAKTPYKWKDEQGKE